MNYHLTSRALAGLQRALVYVEDHFGESEAADVLDRFEQAFVLLGEYPGSGHRREDLTSRPEVRFWAVGPTLLAYRECAGVCEILFIERGEQDWRSLLGES